MKKIPILTCLFLVCFAANAQPKSLYAVDPSLSAGTATIVRNWGTSRVIAYYEIGGKQNIDMLESTLAAIHRVKLPEHLFLKDIFVDNGIAYFCGSSTEFVTYSVGIIGYFNLADLLTSNVNFHYICNSDVTSVNKLVEYKNGGASHVVALGEKRWVVAPYSYIRHYVMDCPDIVNPSPVPYSTAPFTTDERYFDMVLTDNYVVFTGYNIVTALNAICMRKCLRGATFGGVIDTMHYYPTKNTEIYSEMHTTTLPYDQCATSYLYIDSGPKTRVRTFNVATGAITYSQQFDLSDKAEPKEMVFIPNRKKIVMLEDFQAPSGSNCSNFVDILPWATSTYIADLENKPGAWFNSLTEIDAHCFIAGKGTEWFFRDKNYPATGNPDTDCPAVEAIRVYPIETIEHARTYSQLVPIPGSYNPAGIPAQIYPFNVIKQCENY